MPRVVRIALLVSIAAMIAVLATAVIVVGLERRSERAALFMPKLAETEAGVADAAVAVPAEGLRRTAEAITATSTCQPAHRRP